MLFQRFLATLSVLESRRAKGYRIKRRTARAAARVMPASLRLGIVAMNRIPQIFSFPNPLVVEGQAPSIYFVTHGNAI